MAQYSTPVLIIGSGPAGYTAGVYAARAGLKPILVSGEQTGGQLTITHMVENYPGFAEPILGGDLMTNMRQQALNLGVQIIDDTISEVDFSKQPFECNSANHNFYNANSIIIATGASAKWLGLETENKYRGYGVSSCATCDGFFFKNQNVAVVGGGNTAAEEALYLSKFANSVTIIHRRDSLRAEQALQNKINANPKINIQWDSVVEDIVGKPKPMSVAGIKIKNIKTDVTSILPMDGVFVAIGHHPNTEIFKNHIALDDQGYIITPEGSSKTSIAGVFAAGDVQNPKYRQAIVAAASGCIAAYEVEAYLRELENN